MPSMHRSRTIKYRLTMNCKYVRKMPTTSTRKRKKGRLVEPDLLNNGCTAQWTFGEAGLAVPASTDVTTGEKDDVALVFQAYHAFVGLIRFYWSQRRRTRQIRWEIERG